MRRAPRIPSYVHYALAFILVGAAIAVSVNASNGPTGFAVFDGIYSYIGNLFGAGAPGKLEVQVMPSVTSISLNSTDPTKNDVNQNLTLYYTTTGSGTILNITNWYRNGVGIQVLNMPFEGGSNTTWTKDYSGFAPGGTVSGATNYSSGGYNGKGYYSFNGVSNYISLSAANSYLAFERTNPFSVVFWIKTSSAANEFIVGKNSNMANHNGRGWAVMDAAGRIYLQLNSGIGFQNNELQVSGGAGGATNDGNWHHVVVTYNGSSTAAGVTFYYDGVNQSTLVDSDTLSATILNASVDARIGSISVGGSYYNGALDDMRIYNRTLSAAQVSVLYRNRTDIIVSQELANLETWKGCVTPNDGTQDGSQACSNNLNIGQYQNCPSGDGNWVLSSSYNQSSNISCSNITITSTGALTVNLSKTINATNILIQSGGVINATGLGCPGSQSPNTSNGRCANYGSGTGYGEAADGGNYGPGAGHGGVGGSGDPSTGGYAYDDALLPLLSGSGGGVPIGGGAAGSGGGAIRITAQTLSFNGTIASDGTNGLTNSGGGSGGSILIETTTMSGTGSLLARGGLGSIGSYAGAGSGGRIAVYYTASTWDPMNHVNVSVGVSHFAQALVGTGIAVDLDDNNAVLIGGFEFNRSASYAAGLFKPTSVAAFSFNNLVVSTGTFRLNSNSNISATTLNLTNAGYILCDNGTTGLALTQGTPVRDATKVNINATSVLPGSLLSLAGCGNVIIDEASPQLLNTNRISSDAAMSVYVPSATLNNVSAVGTLFVNASTLTVNGMLNASSVFINATTIGITGIGSINTSGLGCNSSSSPNLTTRTCYNAGTGAGYGEGPDSANYGGGAGHGGFGGYGDPGVSGYAYDDALLPVLPGSGGGTPSGGVLGGAGGGVVRIIAGVVSFNGSIVSDGSNGGNNAGGGSGGSILIETTSLSGNGSLYARGGPPNNWGGAGSGGRIAVYSTTLSWNPSNRLNASNGGLSHFNPQAQTGTAIAVGLAGNDAWLSGGFEFNQSQSYAAGAFKSSAGAPFGFTSLTVLTPSLRVAWLTNVSTGTLNLSATTNVICDNATPSKLFLSNVAVRDPAMAFLNASSVVNGSALNLSNCGNVVIDEASAQFLKTSNISTDADLSVFVPNALLYSLGANSTLLVNTSSSSLAGVLSARTISVNASLLNLTSTGVVGVTGRGCPGSQSPNVSNGRCADFNTSAGYGEGADGSHNGGGGHGGRGGAGSGGFAGGLTYDDPLNPVLPGSGSGWYNSNFVGAAGGGAVRINAQTLLFNGVVNVDGDSISSWCGGGSGGSVFITAGTMSGNGNITARGGPGSSSNNDGGGAGGRVAVYANTLSWYPSSSRLNVSAGVGTGAAQSGSAIAVELSTNNAWITQGMEFNQSNYYGAGTFKPTAGSTFNFTSVNAIGTPTIRFVGPVTLGATLLNLTTANGTVTGGSRVVLQYSNNQSNLGVRYDNSSGSGFQFSVARTGIGQVDWSSSFNNITNMSGSININMNSIYLNSTLAKGLNTSANITLSNLGFSYMGSILVDYTDSGSFVSCGASCNLINFSSPSQTAFFNVTHFTTYTISSGAAPTITLKLNGAASNVTVAYLQTVRPIIGTDIGTVDLYLDGVLSTSRNNTDMTLSVGLHNFTAISGVSSLSYFATVTQSVPSLNLTATPSWTVTEGTQTTVNCNVNTSQVTPALYRAGGSVGIPDVATLSAGSYAYVCNNTAVQNFTAATTSNTLSVTAININSVSATSVTNQSAVITWATDLASNTSLNYGTTTALGTTSGISESVTSHTVSVSGLSTGTFYYYNVTSCTGGACTSRGPYNFTTASAYYTNCPSLNGNWTLSGAYTQNANITCSQITIASGGTLTVNGSFVIRATNMTIATGGNVSADGTGCAGGYAPDLTSGVCISMPGYGTDGYDNSMGAEAGGGGYGGAGIAASTSAGLPYGSALYPLLMGSGGSNVHDSSGGPGGGLVRIKTQALTLNGAISADGIGGAYHQGGGSGGAVIIETGTMTGSGTITASGGAAGEFGGGAGGGGRVAVYYNSATWDPSRIDVTSPAGSSSAGSAIAVDLDDNNAFVGQGMDFNQSDSYAAGSFKASAMAQFSFNSLTFTDATARLRPFTNITASTIDMSSLSTVICDLTPPALLFMSGVPVRDKSMDQVSYTTLVNGNSLSMTGCGNITIDEVAAQLLKTPSFTNDGSINVFIPTATLNSVISSSGDAIINTSSSSISGTVMGSLVSINASSLTINSGGAVSAGGKGCAGGTAPDMNTGFCVSMPGYGTGGYDGSLGASGGGGAYGGSGVSSSTAAGAPYGSALYPALRGSGGGNVNDDAGGAGGGLVRIKAQTLNLAGAINASGVGGAYHQGGGSGGAVIIETGTMTGSGTITASGGAAGEFGGGAGGGGRVAVYYNSATWDPSKIDVTSPAGSSNAGSAIVVDLDDNNAFIAQGMDFNQSDSYAAGSFKPNAAAAFSFNNLTFTSANARLRPFTNVTTTVMDLSRLTNIVCDVTPPAQVFMSGVSLRDVSLNAITYSSLINGASLALTGCGGIVIDEATTQLLNTPSITSDASINVYVPSATLNTITSTAGDVGVATTTSTLAGNVTGAYVSINATTFTINGAVSADAKGCAGGSAPNLTSGVCITGPGYGTGGYDGSMGIGGGGAGYGGAGVTGSTAGGTTYGTSLYPLLKGSGGGWTNDNHGAAGGGAIHIKAQTLNLAGIIMADGGGGSWHQGGGSGGSVLVEVNSLFGVGTITATGGPAGFNDGTAGGGGRVVVYYNTTTWSPVGKVNVSSPGGATHVGTALVVDVNDNTAQAIFGMEFDSTFSSPLGIFKPDTVSSYNFNRLDAINNPFIRFADGAMMVFNATYLNLSSVSGTVTDGTRLVLQYSDANCDIGSNYTAASGSFQFSVYRTGVGRIDWLPSLTNITSLTGSVIINSDSAYLNSSRAKALNASANITLYDVPFGMTYNITNELEDGTQINCMAPSCNKFGAPANAVMFNVSSFTRYFAVTDTTYIAPTNPVVNSTFVFNATQSGVLLNGTQSSIAQTIQIVDRSTGQRRVDINAHFGTSTVDLSTLSIVADATKTVVDFSSVTGVSTTHTLYVPRDGQRGVYVCPDAVSLDQVSVTCNGFTYWSDAEALSGVTKTINGASVTASVDDGDYKVSGLTGTGVASGGQTTLTIWDETDSGMPYGGKTKYANDQVGIFANFTNMSGMPASTTNGACGIDIANPTYFGMFTAMTYNATLKMYTFGATFDHAATFDYKINCTGQGDTISTTDTVVITGATPTYAQGVPEFGTWALLLALVITVAGVAYMRRR